MDELEKYIAQGKVVKVPFCSVDSGGEACADQIKDVCHASVLGTKVQDAERPDKSVKCIVCGKPAKHIVYVAKTY